MAGCFIDQHPYNFIIEYLTEPTEQYRFVTGAEEDYMQSLIVSIGNIFFFLPDIKNHKLPSFVR